MMQFAYFFVLDFTFDLFEFIYVLGKNLEQSRWLSLF